ncbi:hypothetical protein FZEAL_5888 [Fusarium zealandicum]|uniref:Uncharacterized protein n=1 Tax=Fusarium zealandicum TaxID=1053134 RepID=A0A8H4UJK9_9HYPO|nr:hypothetical protein FZEAL_5888 [Fusarium zealandicum]
MLLYMLCTICPVFFQAKRGWNSGVGAVPLIGTAICAIIGGLVVLYDALRRAKYIGEGNIKAQDIEPEDRLLLAKVGGIGFPLTIFWFARSGEYNSILWIVPSVAGTILNACLLLMFVSRFNYLVDTYLIFAASTVAVNTVARSVRGAAVSLRTQQSFHRLGVGGGECLTVLQVTGFTVVMTGGVSTLDGPSRRDKGGWLNRRKRKQIVCVSDTSSHGIHLQYPDWPAIQPSPVYDYILFYRWLSPDGTYERGRVMARLVAEVIEKYSRRIWLDQHEMKRSISAGEVTRRIAETFLRVPKVIILAAPGDWQRFVEAQDIHRWEWEMSLESDKTIWLLQYGLSEGVRPFSKEQLASGLETYSPRLAKLARGRDIQIRLLSMENIDVVLKEIAEAE